MKTALRLALAGLALACSGCSPVYVMKSWAGHSRLMSRRRPIAEVLADPGTPQELKAKLALVEEVRRFAQEAMGMAPSRSYTAYVEVPGRWVTVAVTACGKTAFEPYEWWFPVVGKVPYKGYFDRPGAEEEAALLSAKGYDTALSEIAAYSTVGWSEDPVLSTMLDGPPSRLADTLIHEMSHAAVYFKGQGDFNESMATFIGEEGSADFLRKRFGEGSPEWKRMVDDAARDKEHDEAVEALYGELAVLYAAKRPEAEVLALREAVFARRRESLGLKDASRPLNNAVVLAWRRYHYDLGDFRRAHERLGKDWRKSLALWKSLDKRRPREALKDWLAN